MNNPTTPESSSATSGQPTSDTPPEYANTKGCLWLLILGIVTAVAVIALIVLVGNF